ncbi:MAG: MAPEG family protein [Pseudomonadales bacterium]
MELLTIVTMLALLEVIVFGSMAGYARGKYGVRAPATTGHEMFERHYRVHYNTIEQLVIFLPALWAFGYYIGQYWAAGVGMIYVIGRIIYAVTYIKDPATRGVGTLLSVIPCWILVLGALVGAVIQLQVA